MNWVADGARSPRSPTQRRRPGRLGTAVLCSLPDLAGSQAPAALRPATGLIVHRMDKPAWGTRRPYTTEGNVAAPSAYAGRQSAPDGSPPPLLMLGRARARTAVLGELPDLHRQQLDRVANVRRAVKCDQPPVALPPCERPPFTCSDPDHSHPRSGAPPPPPARTWNDAWMAAGGGTS